MLQRRPRTSFDGAPTLSSSMVCSSPRSDSSASTSGSRPSSVTSKGSGFHRPLSAQSSAVSSDSLWCACLHPTDSATPALQRSTRQFFDDAWPEKAGNGKGIAPRARERSDSVPASLKHDSDYPLPRQFLSRVGSSVLSKSSSGHHLSLPTPKAAWHKECDKDTGDVHVDQVHRWSWDMDRCGSEKRELIPTNFDRMSKGMEEWREKRRLRRGLSPRRSMMTNAMLGTR